MYSLKKVPKFADQAAQNSKFSQSKTANIEPNNKGKVHENHVLIENSGNQVGGY